MKDEKIIESVRQWVETVVVGLNLCPFAKRELVKNRVRFSVAKTKTEEGLLAALQSELELMQKDDSIETSLLIHPNVLKDFFDYNEFLYFANDLVDKLSLEGVIQIASFHPDYQFGGVSPQDVENYTNRSPFPILHLIREEGLERAIANYPDSEWIPEHNIQLLKELGIVKMQDMLQACIKNETDDASNN